MLKKYILPVAMIAMFASCEKDDNKVDNPGDGHEEELITTVRLIFTPTQVFAQPDTFEFVDTDGPGGNSPTVFDTISLNANEVYTVSTEFWNESEAVPENITTEVLDEDDEHIVCYDSDNATLAVSRTDSDGNYEVGLSSSWTTTAVSMGSITVSLKHQPDVKDGTCAPGETDVEVVFPFKIK